MSLPADTGKKNYAYKAHYRESENIGRFAENYGIGQGNTRMLTLTFAKNVSDKIIASSHWNVMLTCIRKYIPYFKFICVWERQKNGSWHLHLLIHAPLTSNKAFRRILQDFISTSNLPFGFFKLKWTSGRDFQGIKQYLTKYLLKECREKGIRYVGYSRNWVRKVKGGFAFAGGQARKWRLSCDLLYKFFPQSFDFFYENVGFETLVQTVQMLQQKSPRDFVLSNPMIHFYSESAQCWYDCKKGEIHFSINNLKVG